VGDHSLANWAQRRDYPARPDRSRRKIDGVTGISDRLERLKPHQLDAAQTELYHSIVAGPRAAGPQHFKLLDDAGGLEGPFNAFLRHPALGDCLQRLGATIRFNTSLTDRQREIAILVVAATWESSYEQHAHEPIARAAGLTDTEIAAIRERPESDPSTRWADPSDASLIKIVRALAKQGDLDTPDFAAAVELIGEVGLFELTTLVGYYATLALQMRVFHVSAPR
jgi:4-carboxymuconolactone decarboxylase